MWLIIGLGNPGTRYSKTRHNIGFMVADKLAERYSIGFRTRELYMTGKGFVEGVDVVLAEPLTFMNRSGGAVRDLMKRHNLSADKLIVIHDDIDMETGRLKIREKGSSGGHRGVEDIIAALGTREFVRVKVGVGRDKDIPIEDYVLTRFRKDELPVISEAVERAAEAVSTIVREGVEKTMNRFNG